jgi:quinol monooxygenase YgiN
MDDVRCPIVELRQYTLHDGKRDVLIDVFEREFIEPQEAAGMAVIGQFRDLDDPNRFVWLRGFRDMPCRAEALGTFYGGQIWKANRDQANATMVDSDNVLLLRPVNTQSGFPVTAVARFPVGHTAVRPSLVVATLYHRESPFDEAFAEFFDRSVRRVMTESGAEPLACLQTEHAENTFPALPVRTGENVFVWFSRFADQADFAGHLQHLACSRVWRDHVQPQLSAMLAHEPQQLRLAPTTRSLLR